MEGVEDWEENKGLIRRASSRYLGIIGKDLSSLIQAITILIMMGLLRRSPWGYPGCGDVAYGYSSYMCFHCGWDEKKIAFSCKSGFCLSCGKVYVDKWVAPRGYPRCGRDTLMDLSACLSAKAQAGYAQAGRPPAHLIGLRRESQRR